MHTEILACEFPRPTGGAHNLLHLNPERLAGYRCNDSSIVSVLLQRVGTTCANSFHFVPVSAAACRRLVLILVDEWTNETSLRHFPSRSYISDSCSLSGLTNIQVERDAPGPLTRRIRKEKCSASKAEKRKNIL